MTEPDDLDLGPMPALDLGAEPAIDVDPEGLFPEEPEPEPAPSDPVGETVQAVAAYESAFQKRARVEQDRFTQATDSEYWVCFCFETRAQKEEFLARSELLVLGDKHIDGLAAAKLLGVEIASPRVKWPSARTTTSLVDLAVPSGGADGEA